MTKPDELSWHKELTLLVAILAFFASAMSAVAAWKSQETANSALEVQRAMADSGGSRLEIDRVAILRGGCEFDSRDRLRVAVGVRNTGHIAGYVLGLSMRMFPADDVTKSATVADTGFPAIEVLPQALKRIDLPLDCGIVQSRIPGGRDDPAEFRQIVTNYETNSKISWFISPVFATDKGFGDSFKVDIVS
ncbi:hypothetical protein [Mycobacteroides chelonae]|uniref:hypothetical protein n=1 Tax=Mycobacteroides chelonae TaxID=1774 RepID=UPI0008A85D6C|nr:hypothetical protein [Mycobacteroides chelonae]OHU32291.1 hypothetical protein BKG78_18640 [Mycobacteroides chelonae]